MLERTLFTLAVALISVIAYRLFIRYQRHRITLVAASESTGATGDAKLLYFKSSNCAGCRTQSHYLAQLDEAHRALVQPVDALNEAELVRRYNVLSLPTTILVDGGGRVRSVNPGVTTAEALNRQLSSL